MRSEMLKIKKVAELNDALRDTIFKPNSTKDKIVFSEGVINLSAQQQLYILNRVKNFSNFNEDNNPFGERDFGAFDNEEDIRIFWKIDYYDNNMEFHSEDKSDPKKTTRLLTIMKASEY